MFNSIVSRRKPCRSFFLISASLAHIYAYSASLSAGSRFNFLFFSALALAASMSLTAFVSVKPPSNCLSVKLPSFITSFFGAVFRKMSSVSALAMNLPFWWWYSTSAVRKSTKCLITSTSRAARVSSNLIGVVTLFTQNTAIKTAATKSVQITIILVAFIID